MPPSEALRSRARRAVKAAAGETLPDARSLLAAFGEALYEWALETDTLVWSAGAAQTLGLEAADIATGRAFAALTGGATGGRADAVWQAKGRDEGFGVPFRTTYSLRRDGGPLHVEDVGCWYAGQTGRPRHVRGLLRIVTERAPAGAGLGPAASLAGTRDRARAGAGGGLLLVEIERSDGAPPPPGALDIFARACGAVLRQGDAVVRLSPTGLAIRLGSGDARGLSVVARRLAALAPPSEDRALIRVSIGGASFATGEGAPGPGELARRAADALDLCRRSGGGFIGHCETRADAAGRRERGLCADEIVHALNGRTIGLAFAPVAEARTMRVAFHDAVARLRDLDRDGPGAAPRPAIAPADRPDLAILLDHRLVDCAVGALAGAPDLRLCLRPSPRALADRDWPRLLALHLARRTDLAGRLTVEVDECALAADLAGLRRWLAAVRASGVRLSVAEAGSGHVPLARLRDLGIGLLRFPPVFSDTMSRSADDRFFLRAMIEAAAGLGIETALGRVADVEAARRLADWGCTYVSGPVAGRPRLTLAAAQGPATRRGAALSGSAR